jgi:hypothetical protein
MMAKQLEVTVNLTNQKVQFTGVSRPNHSITFDYDPPLGIGTFKKQSNYLRKHTALYGRW